MALVEIERFTDVYEADLAAAFLASHGLEVSVTERYQTTVDPLMQRALGIRLMGSAAIAQKARALLGQARAGDFAVEDGDDLDEVDTGTRAAGSLMAVAAFLGGGFWGTSLPRRIRPAPWQGMVLSLGILILVFAVAWAVSRVLRG